MEACSRFTNKNSKRRQYEKDKRNQSQDGDGIYGDMMRQNHHDVNPDGTINLFGAKVELVNDGLLIIWDEEERNVSKLKRARKTRTLKAKTEMEPFNVGRVIVGG